MDIQYNIINVFQFVYKVEVVKCWTFLMAAYAASIIDDKMCYVLFACYLLLCWTGTDSRDADMQSRQCLNNTLAVLLLVSVFVRNPPKLQLSQYSLLASVHLCVSAVARHSFGPSLCTFHHSVMSKMSNS